MRRYIGIFLTALILLTGIFCQSGAAEQVQMQNETESVESLEPMERMESTETMTEGEELELLEAETEESVKSGEIQENDAPEPELTEQPMEFDVPGISEEIEALIGDMPQTLELDSEDMQEKQSEVLYRILNQDKALQSYDSRKLESVYDPRDKGLVTSVRLQSSNTCWAFSSIAAGEQSLVYKGAAKASALDLSEAHLAYFFYHPVTDPLGNTEGDGNYNVSSSDYLAAGSNTIFSTFALANWVGAADEKVMPYEELDASKEYAQELAYQDTAHLQNAYWINFKDVDAAHIIKQMIKKYGGAAINFYWNSRYYSSDNCAYYFPLNSSQANNHSVTIVGWDDTYSRDNFNGADRPAEDGAWIVKNSYGSMWGEEGYFYLSYEDSAVNKQNTSTNRARAYVFDFEPADNYDYNYQHDGSAGAYNATNSKSTLTKVESGSSIANVFTVQDSGSGHREILKAVSFALFDTAVNYRIQIYKNLTDSADPASGIAQLHTPLTGSTSYAGYYTLPLNQEIILQEGETFSVVITVEKESGEAVNFFIDKSYQNGNWVSFVNEVEKGESFRLLETGWEDMADHGAAARIKAFTDNETKTDEIPGKDDTPQSTETQPEETEDTETEDTEREENSGEPETEDFKENISTPEKSNPSTETAQSEVEASGSPNTSDTSAEWALLWMFVLTAGAGLLRRSGTC